MDEKRKKIILGVAAGVVGLLAIILIARAIFGGGAEPQSTELERIQREGSRTPPPPSSTDTDVPAEPPGSGRLRSGS